MKKINFLMIFLMIFSLFFVFNTKPAYADESVPQIKITTTAPCLDGTNTSNGTFKIGFASNQSITFECTLSLDDAIGGQTAIQDNSLNYEWLDYTKDSQNPTSLQNGAQNTLVLTKTIDVNNLKSITVGTRVFGVHVTGGELNYDLYNYFNVEIVDNSAHELILTELSRPLEKNTNGAYIISTNSEYINILSRLTTVEDSIVSWYYITPDTCSYESYPTATDGSCNIVPASLIGDHGYGKYMFFAIATKNSVTYTSKIVCFEAVAQDLKVENNYYISKKVIDNSKTDIEAFTFTLENARMDGLDFNKIIWCVNDVKMGKGESFSYEPTKTDTFIVSAKYQGASLTPLTDISITPKTTGTLKLILIIGGAVAVLSLIFGISVKRLNKKRDVVW